MSGEGSGGLAVPGVNRIGLTDLIDSLIRPVVHCDAADFGGGLADNQVERVGLPGDKFRKADDRNSLISAQVYTVSIHRKIDEPAVAVFIFGIWTYYGAVGIAHFAPACRDDIAVLVLKQWLCHLVIINTLLNLLSTYMDVTNIIRLLIILIIIFQNLDPHQYILPKKIHSESPVIWDGREHHGTFHIVRSRQFVFSVLVIGDFRVVRRVFGGEREVFLVPLEVLVRVLGSPSAALESIDHGLAGVCDGDTVAIVEFLLFFRGAERVAPGHSPYCRFDAHGFAV